VHIISTQGSITIAAPEHLKLSAGGAYINIQGGDVQIHGPATMAFKAGMSKFTGPASVGLKMIKFPNSIVETNKKYSNRLDAYDLFVNANFSDIEYVAIFPNGQYLDGHLDVHGRTSQIPSSVPENGKVLLGGKGEWAVNVEYYDEDESQFAHSKKDI